MADTEESAHRTASTRATTSAASTPSNGRRTAHEEEALEDQIHQLQNDIKSISNTLSRLGQTAVKDVQSTARQRAHDIADRGQSMLDGAQGEIGALEHQLKDTIRERPLTAVAGALAVGFLIAVMTR